MTAGAADITGSMATTTENPYLRDAVLTASPEQLHLMLYDGAIRFVTQARDALQGKDFETSFEKLTRGQNIILEMQGGLNYDINRPLCERMSALYNFVYRKLIDANVNRDASHIDDALKVLHIERETWRILVDKVGRLRGEPEAPPTNEQQATFSTEV